jgi:hypothetical protein
MTTECQEALLQILYAFVGYVRMICGVNTRYILLALGGGLCCELAEEYSLKLIAVSHENG